MALVGIKLWRLRRVRAERFIAALTEALRCAGDRSKLFAEVVTTIEHAWPLEYAALVSWRDDGNGGSIDVDHGEGPPEPALMSWLLRDAESGDEIAFDTGHELPGEGVTVGVPLRLENAALVGFLILRGPEHPPPHLIPAIATRLDVLARRFDEAPRLALEPPGLFAPGPSGSRAISSSVASTSGSRRPPTSWPSRLSAALIGIGFVVDAERFEHRRQLAVDRSRAPRCRRPVARGSSPSSAGPTRCVCTQMPPTPPSPRNGRTRSSLPA